MFGIFNKKKEEPKPDRIGYLYGFPLKNNPNNLAQLIVGADCDRRNSYDRTRYSMTFYHPTIISNYDELQVIAKKIYEQRLLKLDEILAKNKADKDKHENMKNRNKRP